MHKARRYEPPPLARCSDLLQMARIFLSANVLFPCYRQKRLNDLLNISWLLILLYARQNPFNTVQAVQSHLFRHNLRRVSSKLETHLCRRRGNGISTAPTPRILLPRIGGKILEEPLLSPQNIKQGD
jgi:hypothetical protein